MYYVAILFASVFPELGKMSPVSTNPDMCSKYSLVGASLSKPHINVKFVWSVCLSVVLSIHDAKTNTNLRVPSVVDCSV